MSIRHHCTKLGEACEYRIKIQDLDKKAMPHDSFDIEELE